MVSFCYFLHRYTLAAQDLVMRARGVLKDRGWRISNDRLGSGDDISVYVIPLIHGNKLSWKRPKEVEEQKEESWVPLGRAGLGVPQQRSRWCHLFPAQVGSLLLKGLSGCASRRSLGFGFLFSIKGLDSQQKLNIKAATECCVSFGSFTRAS